MPEFRRGRRIIYLQFTLLKLMLQLSELHATTFQLLNVSLWLMGKGSGFPMLHCTEVSDCLCLSRKVSLYLLSQATFPCSFTILCQSPFYLHKVQYITDILSEFNSTTMMIKWLDQRKWRKHKPSRPSSKSWAKLLVFPRKGRWSGGKFFIIIPFHQACLILDRYPTVQLVARMYSHPTETNFMDISIASEEIKTA